MTELTDDAAGYVPPDEDDYQPPPQREEGEPLDPEQALLELYDRGFHHPGLIRDPFFDTEYPEEELASHLLESCNCCGWPLPLERPWRACEFAEPWDGCACNGCLRPPIRRAGRPLRYCDVCQEEMRLAHKRAKRRRQGAKSWSQNDEIKRLADKRADYKADIRARSKGPGYSRIYGVSIVAEPLSNARQNAA